MKIQCFTVPTHDGSTHQAKMNQFLGTHQILHIDKAFVAAGHQSFWSFCISYGSTDALSGPRKPKIDYREVLSADQFALYSKLRDLRKQISEAANMPAYAVFNNEHLAAMTMWTSVSKTQLASLEGVGEARVEKFGAPFLALLQKELGARGNPGKGSSA